MYRKGAIRLATGVCAIAFFTMPAAVLAETYPVTGKWTYENAGGDGPAKDCGKRYTDFQGTRRLDKGGSVPDYRNLRTEKSGSNEYKLTEEFYNGQTRGRVTYTLHKRDENHMEMRMSGKTFQLRRCE